MYVSAHESLFQITPQQQQEQGETPEQRDRRGNDGGTPFGEGRPGFAERTPPSEERGGGANQDEEWSCLSSNGGLSGTRQHLRKQLRFRVTYAGKGFDPRRMCGGCTEELRAAIVSSGHDLEVWHTVDHERRALVTAQRQHDVLKSRWAERERKERQVRWLKSTLQGSWMMS